MRTLILTFTLIIGLVSPSMAQEATQINEEVQTTTIESDSSDDAMIMVLGISLMVIMFGMGLGLRTSDFLAIFSRPKAVLVGAFGQLIMLPLVAFALAHLFPDSPLRAELAVGLMLIAACPGGATSNMFSLLAKGDVALSISLTALATIASIVTIPLYIGFSMSYFGMEGALVFSKWEAIKTLFVITLIPTSVGMLVRAYLPRVAEKITKAIQIISMILLFAIITGCVVKQWTNLVTYFGTAGPIALTLNISTILLGYLLGRAFKLKRKFCRTLSIEVGIQNGTLAIAFAAAITGTGFSMMAIPAAVYSLLMFMTIGVVIALFRRMTAKEEEAAESVGEVVSC